MSLKQNETVLAPTDMVAMNLDAILQPLCDQLAQLCLCLQQTAQVPGVHACIQFPFSIISSLPQLNDTFSVVYVFQVPIGQIGYITRIRVGERYPGSFYGATFSLLINDSLSPEFPRLDHATGMGMQDGISTRICLQEQDIISVMIECPWSPVEGDAIESNTYIQTLFPFQIEGYTEFMQIEVDVTVTPTTGA